MPSKLLTFLILGHVHLNSGSVKQMNVVFAEQVPKELSSSQECIEDVYAISKDYERIVLCDGASESFDPRSWAELLASKFLRDPEIKSGWFSDLLSSYREQYDYQQMSWSKQASFDRGSFSTLLSVVFFSGDRSGGGVENYAQITGIGDTVAFLLCEGSMIDSFPYTHVDEFQLRPRLLSTSLGHNDFISSSDFEHSHREKWIIDEDKLYHILIMTDAIAEWALRSSQTSDYSWERLLFLRQRSDLEELVLSERSASNMKTDDTTLITIAFEGV